MHKLMFGLLRLPRTLMFTFRSIASYTSSSGHDEIIAGSDAGVVRVWSLADTQDGDF